MTQYIIRKARSFAHNIYHVTIFNYHHTKDWLFGQGKLLWLITLVGETVTVFLMILLFLIVMMGGPDRW